MKIVNGARLSSYPPGTMFSEMNGHNHFGEIHVKDSLDYGARTLSFDSDGDLYDYDWNVYEEDSDFSYVVYETEDILKLKAVIDEAIEASKQEPPPILFRKNERIRCECGGNYILARDMNSFELGLYCMKCRKPYGKEWKNIWSTATDGYYHMKEREVKI